MSAQRVLPPLPRYSDGDEFAPPPPDPNGGLPSQNGAMDYTANGNGDAFSPAMPPPAAPTATDTATATGAPAPAAVPSTQPIQPNLNAKMPGAKAMGAPNGGPPPTTAQSAIQNALTMQPPAPPGPAKWYQKLAAMAEGAAGGWVNAAGRTHIDPKQIAAAEQETLAPGYARQVGVYQQQQQDALAKAELAKTSAGIEDLGEQRKAKADLSRAQALKAAEDNDTRLRIAADKIKEADLDRKRKGFASASKDQSVVYQDAGTPVPDGWQALDNPDAPEGKQAIVPSGMLPVPKGLVEYMQGYTEGQMAPRKDIEKAAKAQQDELKARNVQDNKPVPDKKQVSKAEQVLLNPGDYTPEQVKIARGLFGQEHKGANADGSAGAPAAVRNPSLPMNQRDEGVLSTQKPGDQAVIKQLVDYKYQLPTGIALSKPYWQNMLQIAAQYDPSFDASQYQNRVALRKDFTSGKSSQAINSLNTVTQHVDQLEKNWGKLNNVGGMGTVLNAPINSLGGSLSGDLQNRLNRFQLDQEAVSNELMRVWRQVGASESEIKQWSQKISPNLSPEAQKGAIQEIMELIKGKITALKSQYETGMGRPADFHMVQPDTLKRFQKHGVDIQDLAPNATYGGTNAPAGGQDQMIKVQIPGFPPDQIHASQKDKFLKDHPNAKVF